MSNSNAHGVNQSPPQSQRPGHSHSHSHSHAGLSSSTSHTNPSANSSYNLNGPRTGGDQRYRASVDTGGAGGAGRGWGRDAAASPNPRAGGGRPASELLSVGNPGGAQTSFASPETDAIDRWFEDLQHYEATLEEMAAASLDANFKEELSAIEQWFRVLSEAERTAALYSLLQSSTQVQMRFFVTVLQQMARADPMTALLSPANPGQASMEAQMEAKLAAMGLKSPASPAIRQFARQSLSGDTYLSPHSATTLPPAPVSPTATTQAEDAAAAATLASQRAKLKASSRISAPANILLGASDAEGVKSPLWSEKERVVERRSPSPSGRNGERPKSTGSTGESQQPNSSHVGKNLSQSTGPPSASFLRSPAPDFDSQLSPIVGGSWASMVNTPLVPMFGSKGGDDGGSFGGLSSPGLDGATAKLGSWAGGATEQAGIVLDDVRKFRRSARISGSSATGFGGGALGGMYDDQPAPASTNGQQPRRASPSHLNSMQQNAINLGLAGLQQQQQHQQQQQQRSGSASPGLSSQQAAVAAQQNWRNGLGSPAVDSGDQYSQHGMGGFGMGMSSPGNLSANAQLANLFALQQQMMQQQQMQQLNMAAAAGIALTPVQMMGLQQQQQQAMLSPGGRGFGMGMNGMGGMGMGMGMGMGLGGMGSPRRSPRQNDRSPGGKTNLPSTVGSGSNPDEAVDLTLLGDIPAWLRSLRLHKYTPNFEGSHWREMVLLDDAGLEGKGVSALGARRKLLKVFETVRGKMNMALPGDGVPGAHDGGSTRSESPPPERDP